MKADEIDYRRFVKELANISSSLLTKSKADTEIGMAISRLDSLFVQMRTHTEAKISSQISGLLENDPDNPVFSAVSLYGTMNCGRIEVAHTNTLAWLLNPKAEHGFVTLLLEAFFSHFCDNADASSKLEVKYITSEFVIKEDRRIDIWAEGNIICADNSGVIPWLIVVECKIDHHETDDQLKYYEKEITKWKKNNKNGNEYLIFLTKDKNEAETGTNKYYWRPVSFEELFASFWKQSKYLKNRPGYQFLRLYLAGVLKDIMGWTLPLDRSTDSPYEALLLLNRLNERSL